MDIFLANGNVDALISCLDDRNINNRDRAAKYLGQLGNPIAIHPLVKAFYKGPISVSTSAINAIVQINHDSAIELLKIIIDYMAYIDEKRLKLAVWALGYFPSQKSVQAAIKCLGHSSDMVRLAAVKTLQAIKDPRASQALIFTLTDSSKAVRDAAADALSELGTAEAYSHLRENRYPSQARKLYFSLVSQAIETTNSAQRNVQHIREKRDKGDKEEIERAEKDQCETFDDADRRRVDRPRCGVIGAVCH